MTVPKLPHYDSAVASLTLRDGETEDTMADRIVTLADTFPASVKVFELFGRNLYVSPNPPFRRPDGTPGLDWKYPFAAARIITEMRQRGLIVLVYIHPRDLVRNTFNGNLKTSIAEIIRFGEGASGIYFDGCPPYGIMDTHTVEFMLALDVGWYATYKSPMFSWVHASGFRTPPVGLLTAKPDVVYFGEHNAHDLSAQWHEVPGHPEHLQLHTFMAPLIATGISPAWKAPNDVATDENELPVQRVIGVIGSFRAWVTSLSSRASWFTEFAKLREWYRI